MTRVSVLLLTGLLVLLPLAGFGLVHQADDAEAGVPQPSRFGYVEIYVDSGDAALGAYQVDLSSAAGEVMITGIEGGAHPAFAGAPHYDAWAMQHDRVIIGAFDLSDELPTGRTRVARIHVRVKAGAGEAGGKPTFTLVLDEAADGRGRKINATATFEYKEAGE